MSAGLDIELSRFVQIVGAGDEPLGSGFRLSSDRVLTARHVIEGPSHFWVRDPSRAEWTGSADSPAEVVWPPSLEDPSARGLDAVILKTPPVEGVGSWIRFLDAPSPATQWQSYGYPKRLVELPEHRQHLRGTVSGHDEEEGTLGLTVGEGIPKAAQVWDGVSGAPILARITSSGPWVVFGVLSSAWEDFSGSRLTAVAMPALLAAPGFRACLDLPDFRSHCDGFLKQAALLVDPNLAVELVRFHDRWVGAWQVSSDPEKLVEAICLDTPVDEVAVALADTYCDLMDGSKLDLAARVFELLHCALPAAFLSQEAAGVRAHTAAELTLDVFTDLWAEMSNAVVDGKPVQLAPAADPVSGSPTPIYKLPYPSVEAGVDPEGEQGVRDTVSSLCTHLGVLAPGDSLSADQRALRYIAQIALRKPGGGFPTLFPAGQLAAFDRRKDLSQEEKRAAILEALNQRLASEARKQRRFYVIADPHRPDAQAFFSQLRTRLPEVRQVIVSGASRRFGRENRVEDSIREVYRKKYGRKGEDP